MQIFNRSLLTTTFLTCSLLFAGASFANSDTDKEELLVADSGNLSTHNISYKGGSSSHRHSSHIKTSDDYVAPVPSAHSRATVTGEVNFQYGYVDNKKGFDKNMKQHNLNTQYSLGGGIELFLNSTARLGALVNMKYARDQQYNLPLSVQGVHTGEVGGGLSVYETEAHLGDYLTLGPVGVSSNASYTTTGKRAFLVSAEGIAGNKASAASADNNWGYSEYIKGNKVVVPVLMTHVTEAAAYLETAVGRVEMGQVKGPEERMRYDADSLAKGSGGLSGDWKLYANLKGDTFTPDITGRLPGERSVDYMYQPGMYSTFNDIRATKIAYYTPKVGALQLGVAYTLDQGDNRPFSRFSTKTDGDYKDVMSGAVAYDLELRDAFIKISAIGEYGKHEKTCAPVASRAGECGVNHYDLKSYGVGAVVDYAGFGFAASYGNLGLSGIEKDLRDPYDYSSSDAYLPGFSRDFSSPVETKRGVPSENIINRMVQGTVGATRTLSGISNKSAADLLLADSPNTLAGDESHIYVSDYKNHVKSKEQNKKLKDTYYATLGASYEVGEFGLSISYMHSRAAQSDRAGGRSRLDAAVMGLDYELAKGMMMYVEGVYFKTEDKTYASGSELAFDKVTTVAASPTLNTVAKTSITASNVDKVLVSGVVATAADYTGSAVVANATAPNAINVGSPSIRPGELYNNAVLPKDNKGYVVLVGSKIIF